MDGFARLPKADRAFIFEDTAVRRHLANPGIVEKDFWVSWTLKRLYANSALPRLLFKGGTSLSKCFGLIYRFSEDIDLGIEREDIGLAEVPEARCLMGNLNPESGTSRKAYARAVEAMKVRVRDYLAKCMFPAIAADFHVALGEEFILHPPELGTDEPIIRFEYPRALDAASYNAGDYVASTVRLEFGARSDHDPLRSMAIKPYAADEFGSEFKEPTCNIVAQAPERTLLEKALIIHAAINQGRIKRQSSRHAYDLAMLHRDSDTMAALTRELYERVAYHKFVFGENTTVRDAPKNGIRLVPEGKLLRDLESDFRAMQPMFYTNPGPPSFEAVLAELAKLESALRLL